MDPKIVNAPNYRDSMVESLKAIPSLSLVMARDDWFGENGRGIYIQGQNDERAVSAELLLADGSPGFQIDCTVMIVGGSSSSSSSSSPNRWKMDKLSMRLKFRGEYGPSKLRYPVFGDRATDEFDTLVGMPA